MTFLWKTAVTATARDEQRRKKIEDSQTFLLNAAAAVTDVASALVAHLKSEIGDEEGLVQVPTKGPHEGIVLCSMQGAVQFGDKRALDVLGSLDGKNVADLFEADADQSIDSLFFALHTKSINRTTVDTSKTVKTRIGRIDWLNGSASMTICLRPVDEPESFARSFIVVQDEKIVGASTSVERMFGHAPSLLLGHSPCSLFPNEGNLEFAGDLKDVLVSGTHDDGSVGAYLLTSHEVRYENDVAKLIVVVPAQRDKIPRAFDLRMDNGIDVIVCFDAHGRITFANSSFAKIYNRTRLQILSMNIKDLMSEEERHIFAGAKAIMNGQHPSCRVQSRHEKDGRTVIYDWICRGTFDAQGRPIEYMRTGRDISSVIDSMAAKGYF